MLHLMAVGVLGGIGFTISLFIASLACEHGAAQYFLADQIGILAASIVAGILGYLTLRLTLIGPDGEDDPPPDHPRLAETAGS
jgi:NhaA family Na+:H+ antiporter